MWKRRESVISARSARVEVRDGERFVVLSNGQRMESGGDKPGTKISAFDEYGTRIGTAPIAIADEGSVKTRSTPDLLGQASPMAQAELGWRIGLAFAALNFVLLALALPIAVLAARGGVADRPDLWDRTALPF